MFVMTRDGYVVRHLSSLCFGYGTFRGNAPMPVSTIHTGLADGSPPATTAQHGCSLRGRAIVTVLICICGGAM